MNEWISVEDQTPEPEQEVLGVHPILDDGIYVVCFLTQRIDDGPWFWECSNSGEKLEHSMKPLYWMPLPESPK